MTPSATLRGGRQATWTRDTILTALRRYAALYGDDFTTASFNPSTAKWRDAPELIDRYYEGDPDTGAPWPSLNTIKSFFDGSFNAARVAAGLLPNTPGPSRGKRPTGKHRPIRGVSHVTRTVYVEKTTELERACLRLQRAQAQLAELRAKPKVKTVTNTVALAAARDRAKEARTTALRLAGKLERAEATIATLRADRREDRATIERLERLRAAAEADVREVIVERVVERVQRVIVERPAPEEAVIEKAKAEARAAVAAERAADARARAADESYRELAEAVHGSRRHLSSAEIAELRERGPAGPAVLGAAMKQLAKARRAGGRDPLAAALTAIASAAVSWRDRL